MMPIDTSPSPAAPTLTMREAHAHLAQHGRAMSMERLADCENRAECIERIATAASRFLDPNAWILGVGLRVESWPDPSYPAIAELDRAAAGRPICLWSFDHHSLVANTSALQMAGISAATPDPPHGRIIRDRKGEPTGVLLESAAQMVWSRIPEPDPSQWRALVRTAVIDLVSHGFAEVHDLLSQPWLGAILADLDDAGELPIRIFLYPHMKDLPGCIESSSAWRRPRVQLAGGKLFADGTLNSRTAWMLEPYADPLPGLECGEPMASQADLLRALATTSTHDLCLAVHAIGDGAVRAVLDAAESHTLETRKRPRLRIEHAELIHEADVPRFAELGITASVQPCHLLTDIEVLRRTLPGRLHRVLPLRNMIDSGLTPGRTLLFGSDTPIVRPHPRDSIQAAQHRRRTGMSPEEAIAPDQAITQAEAEAAFMIEP